MGGMWVGDCTLTMTSGLQDDAQNVWYLGPRGAHSCHRMITQTHPSGNSSCRKILFSNFEIEF